MSDIYGEVSWWVSRAVSEMRKERGVVKHMRRELL